MTLTKEHTRHFWGRTLLEDSWRDLRHALRVLKRAPTFTAVAILSLALGIGANTAIFSLADAVIFRDLPVREPGRLFLVRGVHQRGINLVHSYPLYQDIRDRTQAFASTVCAGSFANPERIALALPDATQHDLQVRITVVSGNYFATLGIEPVIGRTFTLDDDRVLGGHPVAVLSYRFWKRAFDAKEVALNARLSHNGISYQILGVTPPGFTGISSNDDPDIWLPSMMAETALSRDGMLKSRGMSFLYVFGRLKPGVTTADASADLNRIYGELQLVFKDYNGQRGDVAAMAKGVQTLRERFERPLLVLLVVVGLLLLIACANLAAVLLARGVARRQEIAVRLSLGATRGRLLRQFLVESVLIALLGGAAGLAVSAWAASLLIGMVTTSTRQLPVTFSVDTRILLFTACLSILAALVFGLLPALQANRSRFADTSRSHTRALSRLPSWRLLMAGQMALALFLLIVAGLFIRSLGHLQHIDTGFQRNNVLVLMLDPRAAYGKDMEKYFALYRNLTQQVEAFPGVRAASFSSASFFGGGASRPNITYEGQERQAPEDEWPIRVKTTPRFVETLGLTLLAGRTFAERDNRTAVKVGIISESIARRNFPGANPVGKHFCFSSKFEAGCAIEIVGVIRDVRYSNLRDASPYTLYVPIEQSPAERGDLQVNTWTDPAAMAGQVQQAVRRYDPGLRVVHTATLERLVQDSIVQDRLVASLAAFFAVLALVLSAVGLYGITSYGVHHRTNEIGLRRALGASTRNVQWMVMREVLMLVVAGAVVGISVAVAASWGVRGLLFGVTPTDPLTVTGATLLLIAVTMLAGYLPARRACSVDPLQALRNE